MEFALLLPLLVLIVLGTVDFGRAFFAYVSVTNAARNGADFASIGEDASADLVGIRQAVADELEDLSNITVSNPTVSVLNDLDSQGRLQTHVTVDYTFSPLFPWPGIPEAISVARTVTARVAE